MRSRVASSSSTPCSIDVAPASTARRAASAACAVRAAVRVEMGREMDVGVDAAGHDGQPAQVVRRCGEGRVETRNARSGDHDGGIVEYAATAVEDRPCAYRDGRRLCEGESGKQGE